MKYFDAGYFDIGGQRLYVSRTGWTVELGYEIYADGDSTDHKRLWNDLFQAGSPHGLVFGCLKVMGIRGTNVFPGDSRRLTRAIPFVGPDKGRVADDLHRQLWICWILI